ncbi:MAG: TonB-dependent receptor [Sulfuricella sp.]|nr:TonB-dependent receptor [Sulfuricella sp.]
MKFRKAALPQLIAGVCVGMAGNAWCAEADQDAAQTMKEVVVTSSTIDDRFESRRNDPTNVNVISGKKVDDAHIENIMQVLQSIPGVTADVSSGDELKIKLRGIENQRYMGEKPGVAIVIDGVPVFERTGKVNIDLDNIESIKVIKGGASYLFGDDGLSGAVIITTKRGAKYAGYTLGTEVGSYGFQKGIARAGFAGEKGSGHIQVTNRQSDDYYYQSPYKTQYLDGNMQLYLTDTSDLTFGFETSQREKDKHGSVTGATQAALDPTGMIGRDYTRKYDVDLQKLNLTYSNNYDQKSNVLLSGYEFRDHTMFWSAPQRVDATGKTVPNSSTEAYTTNNDYHQLQRGLKGEWRSGRDNVGWLGGLDVRRNNYKNLNTYLVDFCSKTGAGCLPANFNKAGSVIQDDSVDESVNAVYGELKFSPTKPLTLTFNGRYDNIGLDYSSNQVTTAPGVVFTPPPQSKSFDVTSWRGGANYALTETMGVYGNVSTGFRAPSIDQLYRGSISPTGGKTANNENLKPEQALNMEIGLRSKSAAMGVMFDWDAALFQIDRKDFILATSGQYGGTSTEYVEKYDNIGGVRNRGFELSLKSDRKREFSLDVAYTYITAYFTQYDQFVQTLGSPYAPGVLYVPFNNTGRHVPRVPTHMLNTTLNWQASSAFRMGLEMDAKSWSWSDEINQNKLPGRTLFNLLANYDIKEKGFMGAKWSLFARVNNLFDRSYWSSARGTNDSANYLTGAYDKVYNADDPSIIVGKPRTWYAGVSATF